MKFEAHLSYFDVQQMVDRIVASGRISRVDQQRFMSALLSQKTISKAEQVQVNRVFDLLRSGRLKVID